jgi:hypothetical protein
MLEEQTITKEQVSERLDSIKQIIEEEHPAVASEKAHIEQDKLFKDVLEGIANGAEDPVGLAEAALQVLNLEFTRWYK